MTKRQLARKIKGIVLVISGVAWIVLVYNFDTFLHRPTVFGTKAIICFAVGFIAVINGIRIFRRRL